MVGPRSCRAPKALQIYSRVGALVLCSYVRGCNPFMCACLIYNSTPCFRCVVSAIQHERLLPLFQAPTESLRLKLPPSPRALHFAGSRRQSHKVGLNIVITLVEEAQIVNALRSQPVRLFCIVHMHPLGFEEASDETRGGKRKWS